MTLSFSQTKLLSKEHIYEYNSGYLFSKKYTTNSDWIKSADRLQSDIPSNTISTVFSLAFYMAEFLNHALKKLRLSILRAFWKSQTSRLITYIAPLTFYATNQTSSSSSFTKTVSYMEIATQESFTMIALIFSLKSSNRTKRDFANSVKARKTGRCLSLRWGCLLIVMGIPLGVCIDRAIPMSRKHSNP